MIKMQDFRNFLRNYHQVLDQFGDLVQSNTAQVMHAMAHDVCATEAEANTAALRNIMLFATEHSGSTLDATEEYLNDPVSRLRLWQIADAPGQERWMAALNLRQLKNWHAKGLRDFSTEIDEHVATVKNSFTQDEIDELDLLQIEKGNPVFGQLTRIATAAAGAAASAAIGFGFWKG